MWIATCGAATGPAAFARTAVKRVASMGNDPPDLPDEAVDIQNRDHFIREVAARAKP